jgi:hypothetical protein
VGQQCTEGAYSQFDWAHAETAAPEASNTLTLAVFKWTRSVMFWQIFWQAAPGEDSGKVFVLVGATGIEPVTSAV